MNQIFKDLAAMVHDQVISYCPHSIDHRLPDWKCCRSGMIPSFQIPVRILTRDLGSASPTLKISFYKKYLHGNQIKLVKKANFLSGLQ